MEVLLGLARVDGTARVTCPAPAELYPGEKISFSIFDCLQKNLVCSRTMWYFPRKIRIYYHGLLHRQLYGSLHRITFMSHAHYIAHYIPYYIVDYMNHCIELHVRLYTHYIFVLSLHASLHGLLHLCYTVDYMNHCIELCV